MRFFSELMWNDLMATKTTANGFYLTVNTEHRTVSTEHAIAAHLLAFEQKVVDFSIFSIWLAFHSVLVFRVFTT